MCECESVSSCGFNSCGNRPLFRVRREDGGELSTCRTHVLDYLESIADDSPGEYVAVMAYSPVYHAQIVGAVEHVYLFIRDIMFGKAGGWMDG